MFECDLKIACILLVQNLFNACRNIKTGEMVKHTVCCRIVMKLEKVGRNIAATQRVFHRGGDGSKELV